MGFSKILKNSVIFLVIFIWMFSGFPFSVFSPQQFQQVKEVEAASSGPNNPSGTATETGGGTVDWTNPGNITSSDDNRATAVLGKGDTSYYLKGTDFGFSIPSDATIQGIKVEIEKSIAEATNQYTYDYSRGDY